MSLNDEYQAAQELVGTQYCVACYVKGLIEDGEPTVSEMEVRQSILSERPYREDVMLKCTTCKATRSHGFGRSQDEFQTKFDARGKHRLDVFTDDVDEVDRDHLRDLGYIL